MRFDIKTRIFLMWIRSRLCGRSMLLTSSTTSLGSLQKIADDPCDGRLNNPTSYATSCVWNLSPSVTIDRPSLCINLSFTFSHFFRLPKTLRWHLSANLFAYPFRLTNELQISKFFRKYFGLCSVCARLLLDCVPLWSSRSNSGTGISMGHRWSGRLYGEKHNLRIDGISNTTKPNEFSMRTIKRYESFRKRFRR